MKTIRQTGTIIALCSMLLSGMQEASAYDYSDTQQMEGRMIVRQLHERIKIDAGYSPEELEKRVPAFREFYRTQMSPRIKQLATYINPGAMQWVDIDWDEQPEFIFWTEGLATRDVGLKEHLYIVKIDSNGQGYIMKSHEMSPNPSRTADHYKYSRFWSRPNRERDFNPEVRALLTYGSFGDLNIAYTNLEIRWDPRMQKVIINEFRTYFPVAVEGMSPDLH
ncbi:MAG: hypothetical protein OIF57_16365 [Marinobacterium sp.]|nr:hypothetical protein [Marinobacterium sp.]